jgi:hypothetical protein
MKLAPIFVLAGVTLAAAAWFLSGSDPNSAVVDRNPVTPRSTSGPESRATGLGNKLDNVPVRADEGLPAAATALRDRSSAAGLPTGGVSEAKRTPADGDSPQIAAPDAFAGPTTPSLTNPPPRGQVDGTAARAPAADTQPSPLIPATPADASSVSPPLAVPAGARLPALFLDERPLPAPQRRVLDRIANEFIDAVAGDPTGQDRAFWESAREAADQQYIKLYGHSAYNALHMRAAKEAVRERRTTATPTPP